MDVLSKKGKKQRPGTNEYKQCFLFGVIVPKMSKKVRSNTSFQIMLGSGELYNISAGSQWRVGIKNFLWEQVIISGVLHQSKQSIKLSYVMRARHGYETRIHDDDYRPYIDNSDIEQMRHEILINGKIEPAA